LVRVGREQLGVQVLERTSNSRESPLRITLVQAMSRGERMDYCLQKATELGVTAIQLLLSERVELKLTDERLAKRLTHWRGVMESACEQSGRARVPDLRPPIGLEAWLEGPGQRWVLDADAATSLRRMDPGQGIDLAVGPEGGFTESELSLMTGSGVVAVRLGPRTLRTETAGPAAVAVLQSMAGDWV
jgi:16S rRNA (uracil1498-N3)-methyltransferase